MNESLVAEASRLVEVIAKGENLERVQVERWLTKHRHSPWCWVIGSCRRQDRRWEKANQNLARTRLCLEGLRSGHCASTIELFETLAFDMRRRVREYAEGDLELGLKPHQGQVRTIENRISRLEHLVGQLRRQELQSGRTPS